MENSKNNTKAKIYCTISSDGAIHTEAEGTLRDLTDMVIEVLSSAMSQTMDDICKRGSEKEFEHFLNACYNNFGKLGMDIMKKCVTSKIEDIFGNDE